MPLIGIWLSALAQAPNHTRCSMHQGNQTAANLPRNRQEKFYNLPLGRAIHSCFLQSWTSDRTRSSFSASSSVLRCCNRRVLVMKTRTMNIERKVEVLGGPARIGRVTFSKSGQSVYYKKRRFETLGGQEHKANYFDSETDERH